LSDVGCDHDVSRRVIDAAHGLQGLRYRYYRQYPNSLCSRISQLAYLPPILRIMHIYPTAPIIGGADLAGKAAADNSQPLLQ
jgi:hypothetical protein